MEHTKNKVLILVTKGNFGGAQRYVFDLATHLPKKDFEVLVASGEGESLGMKLSEKGVRSIDIESLGREVEAGRDFKAFKEIRALIKNESPDITHFNSSKMGLLGALAVISLQIENEFIHGKDHKVPKTIFTGHGWAHHEKQRSIFWRAAFYLLHYVTMLLCDETILVADMLKEDYRFMPFLKNKINVIHNGINSFRADAKEHARHEILGGKQDKKHVLFSLSELHPNKGIDVAIKAISLLPQSVRDELYYAVAGSGEDKTKLENQIAELNLQNTVSLLGFIDNGKRLLSGADLFLLPSRKEAYPYALLEAGAIGLPIIATSVGGIPEIIHDMQNGILVHKENPRELAEAILYMLENKTKKREFGQEIKRTVQNFFSLENMLRDTMEVYGKIISKP
jgi:glycosyltransferase involved in cell wall biosynthesis